MGDNIDHPDYYGGDSTYEAIKVIEAWNLGFLLGNCVKYISRAGKKVRTNISSRRIADKIRQEAEIEDLKKARWYLDRKIQQLEGEKHEPERS